MELRQLEYFLTLADTPSFAAASERLYITRQGLSRSIAQLEGELGFQLFERTNSGLNLTRNGRIFQEHVRAMMEEYHTAIGRMRSNESSGQFNLRFLVPNCFWANVSVDMILSFFELHPQITHTPVFASDKDLLRTFLSGDFDFAFTTEAELPDSVDVYPLFDNYRCISVREGHPLAALSRLHTRDLRDHRIAAPTGGSFDYEWLAERCRRYGFYADLLEIGDGMTTIQYARSGKLPTITIGSLTNTVPQDPAVKSIFWDECELDETTIHVRLITKKNTARSAPVLQLIEHVQNYCREALEKKQSYPFRR